MFHSLECMDALKHDPIIYCFQIPTILKTLILIMSSEFAQIMLNCILKSRV